MHGKSYTKPCKTATDSRDTTLARHRDEEQELFMTPATQSPEKLPPSTKTREPYAAKTSEKPLRCKDREGNARSPVRKEHTHITMEPV